MHQKGEKRWRPEESGRGGGKMATGKSGGGGGEKKVIQEIKEKVQRSG